MISSQKLSLHHKSMKYSKLESEIAQKITDFNQMKVLFLNVYNFKKFLKLDIQSSLSVAQVAPNLQFGKFYKQLTTSLLLMKLIQLDQRTLPLKQSLIQKLLTLLNSMVI